MRKPAKRPAKRAATPSPALPENSPGLPIIPRRYSRRSADALDAQTLERRAATLERALTPAPADGWSRVGDPSQRIRQLLAAGLLAEAERVFWDGQAAIREARRRHEEEQRNARNAAKTRNATAEVRKRAAPRREQVLRIARALRTKDQFATAPISELAKQLRRPPYSIDLGRDYLRKILSAAKI